MTRHFLGLYLLIILTLAAVSWGQDRILELYGSPEASEDRSLRVAVTMLADRLHGLPAGQWRSAVADLSRRSGVDMELFTTADIAGRETLQKLGRGETVYLQSSRGRLWSMQRLDAATTLAIESAEPATHRS